MKKLTLTSVLLAVTSSITAGTLDGARAIFFPSSTPSQSAMEKTTPEILKVSWTANPGENYIIERSPTVSGVWRNFSIEHAVESPTRRSIVMADKESYYRILVSARFGVGDLVNWKLEFPNISSNVIHSCSATWIWDNGTSK